MQGPIKYRKTSYQRDFDIQRSWIPSNKDITESMLSYSKRMSEVSKSRGIHSEKLELPLLIKATHLPHPNKPSKSQKRHQDHNYGSKGYTYRARSLPNMKLEPLLGAKAKYELNTANVLDIQGLNGVKLKFLKAPSKFLEQLPPIEAEQKTADTQKADTNALKDPSVDTIKVAMNLTETLQEENIQPQPTEKSENVDTNTKLDEGGATSKISQHTHKLMRKNKRMKFKKSKLEAIEEDDREPLLQRLSRSSSLSSLTLPVYAIATPNVGSYRDIQQSLEERRRDVALLRKIHNSSNSKKLTSQMTMQAFAKKKLRKLPPLSTES